MTLGYPYPCPLEVASKKLLHEPGVYSAHLAAATVDGYIRANSGLNDRERAYCRCLLHVAARTLYGRGDRTNNPYAICTSSVGTQAQRCSEHYVFDEIPEDELRAWARMHGKSTKGNRADLIRRANVWQKSVAPDLAKTKSRGRYGAI